ncbi:M14 family zinc carboxypeptidase [Candidatus Poribacteria bacterium]
MHIKIPEIVVPNFWLSNFGKIQNYLHHRLERGKLYEAGKSSLGYPVNAVEYQRDGCVKLMVMGGTHGHEPGTVATAMNLIHLMESGRDLADKPHDHLLELLESVHLYVVPCLNPDGRTVCPDSFYAMSTDMVKIYSNGLQKDGSLIPYDSGSEEPLYYFDPEDAIFIGGQFNGAGYAMNRRRSCNESDAVGVQAVFEFVRDRGLDGIIDLHACANNFAIQARSHEAPYWPVMREWQKRAEKLFGEKGRKLSKLHGDGDPPEAPKFYYNSSLFHKHAQLMFFAYEGQQGYLGNRAWMPPPTEWEIVDDYLSAITVFVELGVEEYYARANREVFG